MAQVPGAFIQTADVTFDNVLDLVLQVEATAGFAVADYGVLPAGGATPTGLVGATTYTASIDVDAPGGAIAISVLGSAAQTFTTLVAEINTDLAGAAVAALVGGTIVITSATTGVASAVVVTDTDLFRSVKGSNFGLASIRSTRGTAVYVKWNALGSDLQDEWAAQAAVLSPTQTFKTYASDSVTVAGTGVVAASPMSLSAATYDLSVAVGAGGATSVAVAVTGTETFASFITKFNTALQAQYPSLTATLVAATNLLTILVTTNVPGNIASAVPVVTAGTVGDLIAALTAVAAPIDFTAAVAAGTAGTEGTVGTSNTPALYKGLLVSTKGLAGVPLFSIIPTKAFFRRLNKPAARGDAREVSVYYNGAAWVDFTTDLAIA
jgi:hypothetical protein